MHRKYGIYHDKDLDGLACAAIMKMANPGIELIGWDYSYNPEELFAKIERSYGVIMADVSLKPGDMKSLAQANHLEWIDHHAMHIENMHAYDIVSLLSGHKLESGVAACELLWEYLFPGKQVPTIIRRLGIYDTWRKNEPEDWDTEILPLQMALRVNFDIDEIITLIEEPSWIATTIGQGDIMLKYEMAMIRMAIKNGMDAEAYGMKMLVVNGAVPPGRAFDIALEHKEDLDILVVYYRHPDGEWRYSLRSADDGPDVAELASAFGGGGHANAAGFKLNRLLF